MGYELCIRWAGPDPAASEADLCARLSEAQAGGFVNPPAGASPAAAPPAAPSGPGPWTLRNGKSRVDAQLSRQDGTLRGVDLDVPFGGSEEELRRAFAFASSLAKLLGALVFDPQLGREVGQAAVEEVVARWRQSQQWMVDVAGTYEDTAALAELAPPPPLVSRTNKVILAILGGFVLLYWIIQRVADLLR